MATGRRLVEFLTSSNTATQHFAIKVEDQGGNPGQLQVQANLFPRTYAPDNRDPLTLRHRRDNCDNDYPAPHAE